MMIVDFVPLRPIRSSSKDAAFSLVEVCLALGIIAYAILPLIGLLAIGLGSYHSANMRGRAAQAVGQIASCIQLATTVTDSSGKPTGLFTAMPPFQPAAAGGKFPISWNLNGSAQQFLPIYLDENGELTTLNPPSSGPTGWKSPQMVAVVIVTAPTSKFDPGVAAIAVAWPAVNAPSPTPSPTNSTISFVSPQGHEESTLFFIPNPP